MERPADMLNTALAIMNFEQAIAFWEMNWKTDSEGRGEDLWSNKLLFVRDIAVGKKAFKGMRMNVDTARVLNRLHAGKVVLCKERGLFATWDVEVHNHEVVAVVQ